MLFLGPYIGVSDGGLENNRAVSYSTQLLLQELLGAFWKAYMGVSIDGGSPGIRLP